MTKTRELKLKMCLLGEAGVGKTSLIRKFVVDKFDDKYITTLGTKTSKKTLSIRNGDSNVNLTLIIWDVLGQRHFTRVKNVAYTGANGAFIVVDLNRKDTLYSFDHWLFSLYEVAGEIPIVVLANKNDLAPEFGTAEIEEMIADYSFPYYLTSAKTGENVNDAFYSIGKTMVKYLIDGEGRANLETPSVMERYLDTEISMGRKLTPLEAEDLIIARYCDLLEDTDFAMSIVRMQFKRAGVNFEFPTAKGLTKVSEYLIDAVSDRVEATRLERERRTYASLIRRVDEEAS
ncbi:MAG: GTP-binding protein [Thermoplasmata archaeon]|nr:MAG: GTP-binding protein [Thermoplasmata archaeon]